MREKWNQLSQLRRVLLLVTIGLPLLFALLYPIANSHKGLLYSNDFYRLRLQGDARVYTGNNHGQSFVNTSNPGPGRKTVYTVTETSTGYTVKCQVEGEEFGPYQVETFPASELPGEFGWYPQLSGVEIWRDGERLFRGGYYQMVGGYWNLIREDAQVKGGQISHNAIPNPDEGPSYGTLCYFTLAAGEELTHRGAWGFYALAVLMAVINVPSIFYAEEIFTWSMSWRVREPEKAEPSEWELFSRQLGWYLLLGLEVCLLLYGLFYII